MTSTLIPNKSLTVVTSDFKVFTIRADHPNWSKIMDALRANDEGLLVKLADMKNAFENFGTKTTEEKGNITVEGNSVSYKGKKLFGLDVDRIIEFCSQNLPKDSMVAFLEKKLQNPSYRSIEQLYSFLEQCGLTITPTGNFLAYKGVQEDWYSVTSGHLTLTQGRINETGQIYNGIGETIECPRNEVCDDFEVPCSTGLHIGSLDYAKGFGQRTIIVEVSPADVVSVPKDCSCQKLRCHKYKVVGECLGRLPDTYTAQYFESPADVVSSMTDEDINEGWDEDDEEEICSECDHPMDDCQCGNREYDNGYEKGQKDGIDGLVAKIIQPTNSSYEEGYVDGYNDNYKPEPVVEEVKPVEVVEPTAPKPDSYTEGLERGIKDGKAHAGRFCYETDKYLNDYKCGYNEGYRKGRKGK
jgi:hypothetical protein